MPQKMLKVKIEYRYIKGFSKDHWTLHFVEYYCIVETQPLGKHTR